MCDRDRDQLWNDGKTRGTLEVVADPAKAKRPTDMSEVDVAQGTTPGSSEQQHLPYVDLLRLGWSRQGQGHGR